MVNRIVAWVLICGLSIFASPANAQSSLIEDRLALIRSHQSFGAWTNVDEGEARRQASSGVGPLAGRVVAVKDNIDLQWLPTAAGVRALRNRRSQQNATVVDRLLAAGAIIPGHTNMDTWARGVRSVSELWGSTANARNPAYGPMGSSGGSAVAVALGDADLALGTDTCGSIRYPASANLIYGLRPTRGLVSRAGVVPLSPTQDVVGVLASSPSMLVLGLGAIAGPDERDPLTVSSPGFAGVAPKKRWRVGVIRSLGAYRPDARGTTMLGHLAASGVELVPVSLPALANASVINEEFSAVRELVLDGVPESSWLRSDFSVGGVAFAGKRRARLANAQTLVGLLDRSDLDAIVYPTNQYPLAKRGEKQSSANCQLSATSGLPALAIPHGLSAEGVPVPGVDLLGRAFSEPTLLAISEQLQESRVG